MQVFRILFVLLLGIALIPSSVNAQNSKKRQTINGQGAKVKQTLSVDDFQSVGLALNGTIYVKQGNSHQVEIEAQKNIIENLNLEVKDGSWSIGLGKNKNARNYQKITVWITMPTVKGLSIAGSGEIIGKSDFNNLDDLKLSIGGSGTINFSGKANSLKASIAGSGSIDSKNLQATNAKVSIAGSGKAYLDVGNEGNLTVSIAGSGNVYYKGRAKIKTSIAGSGKVESM